MELPESLQASSYQPLQGWDIDLSGRQLTISGGAIEPAPVVTIQGESAADHAGDEAHDEGQDGSERAASPTSTTSGDAGGSGGPLAIGGLIAGLLGLGLGGGAFARAGREPRR